MENLSVEYIEDDGEITAVDKEKGTVTVRLSNPEECGGCPAAKICGAGKDLSDVTVHVRDAQNYHKGQRVTMRGSERLHRRAIMLATVLPCIALVAVMVTVYLLTGEQATAALCGLGTTVLFFLILYMARNRIAHEFVFEIVEKGEN